MTHGGNNGDRDIAGVTEPGHDDGKPEVLRRRAANQSNNIAKGAADGGAEEDIEGDKPPTKEVFRGDRFTEVDEDEAREEQRKDELGEDFEGGPRNNLGFRVGKDEANDSEGEEFH